jgi:Ala-tRNA(Pro) deacylase
MRVPNYLADQHIPFETVVHPPAFTAARRARFLRVPGRLLAKSVLLRGRGGYLLAVLPATHQVDLAAVGAFAGEPVRLANDQEIAEVFRDCEWGVLTPFGSLYGVVTLLDSQFDLEDHVVFEVHRHGLAVRLCCRDFERVEQPRRLRLAAR